MDSETKVCQNCQTKFHIQPEDLRFYKKVGVPAPTFCPECRTQRRFAFRMENRIYKRKDDFSGKEIFSLFSPEAPIKVYDREIWYSDKWDPMDYGREYNFNKSFFMQFKELMEQVPLPARLFMNLVNSDYSTNASNLKNCYLFFGGSDSENCAYGTRIHSARDSYDNYDLTKCEICYEGFMISNCYKAFFSSNCENCQEISFCHNCIGCQNCFGCTNLRHKKYHIFNRPYSKEEYFKKLEGFNLGSFNSVTRFKKQVINECLKYPHKFMYGRHNHNVSGEYIYNSKKVINSYIIKNGEDLKNCQFLEHKPGATDCYDFCGYGNSARLIYESNGVGKGANRVKFCYACYPGCRELDYCMECHSSSSLFGCIGLNYKQYCILNKQYCKEEYEELIPKIKEQMNQMPYRDKKDKVYKYGEFFPPELCLFTYNETLAQEYFPLTRKEVLDRGYRWYDKPKSEHKPTIKAANLPDYIKDVDNSILKEVIECQAGTVPDSCQGSGVFRIIPQELKFYQKQNIPLPRLCPDCRHRERIKQRNPMKLHKRKCQCAGEHSDNKVYKNQAEHSHHKDKHCPNEFQTTYASDRKEIVYCEKCYLKEMG